MQFHMQHNCISCSFIETFGAEIKHNGNQILSAYQLVHHCEQQLDSISTFLEKFGGVRGTKNFTFYKSNSYMQVGRKFQ